MKWHPSNKRLIGSGPLRGPARSTAALGGSNTIECRMPKTRTGAETLLAETVRSCVSCKAVSALVVQR
jgi:hypothetical protein